MLPETAKPINYKLTFDIDLKNFSFRGSQEIAIALTKPTNRIVLNVVDLKITSCKIRIGDRLITPKITLNKKKEEVALVFNEKTIAQAATIFLTFQGTISDKLAGFYRSKYYVGGKEHFMATTQMEPADARRMFPCFDEPAMKATFDLSFAVDKELDVVSNMPVKEESIVEGKKIVVFEQTPKMSSYLFYAGIGKFEYLEDTVDGVALRVVTTPGKKQNGKFALECVKKFLPYYNEYFGVPYPLPKLDIIAVPDFSAGAMENWGAITFRETDLLFDPRTGSIASKQRIAEVVAHELAHQWFGNLVTMQWWNDLWLNESFATWMEYKVVDTFFPEWDYWKEFVASRAIPSFGLDALKSSHSIDVEVKAPHEVNEIFDTISYGKGACIIRMLESHIGHEIFREGLRKYMSERRFGNAKTEDLWTALEKASQIDVVGMMNGWVKQTGYPMVKADVDGSTLFLEQHRFLFEPGKKPDATVWTVPVSIELYQGKTISILLKEKKKWIALDEPPLYLNVNAGRTGFFRAIPSEGTLQELKKRIADKRLQPIDRWGLQNDLYALVKACRVPLMTYLNFIEAYANEDDYLVCQDIADKFYGIYVIAPETLRGNIRPRALAFYQKQFERLGWDPKAGEKDNDKLLRSAIIVYMGRMGDQRILNEAQRRFQRYLRDPSYVATDLRSTVFTLAAWKGDVKMFDILRKLYEKTEDPTEKRRLLGSLAGFSDEVLLKKALDYSLSAEVRAQDAFLPVALVSRNPIGRNLAWPWVKKHWKILWKRYGKGGGLKMLERFVDTVSGLTDAKLEKGIKAFFSKNKSPGTERDLAQSLEMLRINARFLKMNGGNT